MEEPLEVVLPRRQTHPPIAASFVETRIRLRGEIERGAFLPQLNSFVDQDKRKAVNKINSKMWEDAQNEREKLFQALEKFQAKLPSYMTQREKVIDIRKADWGQVLEEVAAVADRYENLSGSSSTVRKLRSCFRKVGTKGSVLEHWIQLLPEGDYGSSISGAFTLIIKAAKNMDNVREALYDALGDIPEAMEGASTYVNIYGLSAQFNTRLLHITAKLYTAILTVLRTIVEHLSKGSWTRVGKALTLGEGYEKSLKVSIANFKKIVVDLNEEASRCQQSRLYDMEHRQQEMQAEQRESSKVLQEIYIMVSSNENYNRKTGAWANRQADLSPGFGVCTPAMLPIEPQDTTPSPSPSLTPSPSPSPVAVQSAEPSPKSRQGGTKPRKVLEILNPDLRGPAKDIDRCLKSVNTMGPGAIDKAQWITKTPKFYSWLSDSSQSRKLLIQGNRDPFKPGSPLSFLCAHLSDMISSVESAVVISCMCSIHRDPDTDRHDARGMLVSLIGQLLSARKEKSLDFDLSWIKKRDRELLRDDDLGILCRLFRKLVEQMPKNKILFCFIDGISWYEVSELRDDTLRVIGMLQRLVGKELDVLFKLLLTCPNQSLSIHEDMDEDDILQVLDAVDGPGHGVWDASPGLKSITDLEESFNGGA